MCRTIQGVVNEIDHKLAECSLEEHQFRFFEHLIDELHAEEKALPRARPKGGARWNSDPVKSTAEDAHKNVINQRTSFATATESMASGIERSPELAARRVLEERQSRFLRRLVDELRAEERALNRARPKCGTRWHIDAAKPMAQGQPRIGMVLPPNGIDSTASHMAHSPQLTTRALEERQFGFIDAIEDLVDGVGAGVGAGTKATTKAAPKAGARDPSRGSKPLLKNQERTAKQNEKNNNTISANADSEPITTSVVGTFMAERDLESLD